MEDKINQKLKDSAILELRFQYAIWKKDYETAFNCACDIVEILNAPALSGYKCFWNYMSGCMAYYLFKNGQSEYKRRGQQYFLKALKENISIRWLSELPEKLFSLKSNISVENDFFFDCIENIENVFTALSTKARLEKKITGILENLKSEDGKAFERGHKDLGELLGFISENPNSTGAPDPYWIINENNIVVSEDKIYEEKQGIKSIPISDVSEAGRHKAWIMENEKRISKNANIYTVLITNSLSIDKDARIYADNIYYIHRDEYVKWVIKALAVLRDAWNIFTDVGEMEWREAIHQKFIKEGITPKNYIDFVCKQKLKNI